jgi:regulator of replication initiation timing
MLNDLKGRIKHLIEDNNELYMQNSKLKNLIEFK